MRRRREERPSGSDTLVFEADVERIAQGGDALLHAPDGRVTFADSGFPGERVRVALSESHKSWARGEVREVIRPIARLPDACPHAHECGGCRFQGAPYEREVVWKVDAAVAALRRIAPGVRWPSAGVRPDTDWKEYRRRVRFHIGRDGALGYMGRRSHDWVPVQTCPILLPDLDRVRGRLSRTMPRTDAERIGLRLWLEWDDVREQVAATLLLPAPRGSQDWRSAERAVDAASAPFTESAAGVTGTAIVRCGAAERVVQGDGRVGHFAAWEGARVPVWQHAGGFSQANERMNDVLRAVAVEACDAPRGSAVLELYAGSGNFALALLAQGAEVDAVERDADALAGLAEAAAALAASERARTFAADLEDGIPPALWNRRHDVVLLDPPRTGLSGALRAQLGSGDAGAIVYVSCDPPTLARDAAVLASDGWSPRRLTFVDMFPRTAHVETVVRFERGGTDRA